MAAKRGSKRTSNCTLLCEIEIIEVSMCSTCGGAKESVLSSLP